MQSNQCVSQKRWVLVVNSKVLNLCVPHAFFEGKKAGETSPRKSTPRTLKEVGQQYPPVWLTYDPLSEAAGVGASAPPEPARGAALGPKSYRRRPRISSSMLHDKGAGGGHHRCACCSCGPLRRVSDVFRSAMAPGRFGRVCSGAASPPRCARALGAHHSRGSSPATPGRAKAGDESTPVRERCNGCAEGGPD
jgi:hypothetical protein